MSDSNNVTSSQPLPSVIVLGAGPIGLFSVFELGIYGIHAHVIDSLSKMGGQCIEYYPDKPIYDIPGIPAITGKQLIDQLLVQNKPFNPTFHLGSPAVQVDKKDNKFSITLQNGTVFESSIVILALGGGNFTPIKPLIDLTEFQEEYVHYSIADINQFKNKEVVVFGGGNSALDFVFHLCDHGCHVTLVHRSDQFKASVHTVERLQQMIKTHKVDFYQGTLQAVTKDENDHQKVQVIIKTSTQPITISVNKLLICFGFTISNKALQTFPITTENGRIPVSPSTFQTSTQGIYAIGDCAAYKGKQKLILSGFHEAALMAASVYHDLNPDKKMILKHSTSNTKLQQHLKSS